MNGDRVTEFYSYDEYGQPSAERSLYDALARKQREARRRRFAERRTALLLTKARLSDWDLEIEIEALGVTLEQVLGALDDELRECAKGLLAA